MIKSAESPLLRAAINALGTKALLDDRDEAGQSVDRADLNDLVARRREAVRMAPVRRGFVRPGSIAPDSTDYAALGSLRDYDPGLPLALGFEKGGTAKQAGLGQLGRAVGARALQGGGVVSGQVGRLVGAAGRGLEHAGGALQQGVGATGRLVNAGDTAQFLRELRPGVGQRVGGVLQGAGRKVQNAGLGIGVAGQNVAEGAGAMAKAIGKKAPPASSSNKPLLSAGAKAKLLLGAGGLGAGYLGVKGLQATRDYMSVPSGHHHQGYVRDNVSPYGY